MVRDHNWPTATRGTLVSVSVDSDQTVRAIAYMSRRPSRTVRVIRISQVVVTDHVARGTDEANSMSVMMLNAVITY